MQVGRLVFLSGIGSGSPFHMFKCRLNNQLIILHVGMVMVCCFARTAAAQGAFLYSGAQTTIVLGAGTYDINVYGAQGGGSENFGGSGALGAEMEAEFNFRTAMTLIILVGGAGANDPDAGGGGGGSFVVNGATPLIVSGGGGGGGGFAVGNPGLSSSGGAGGAGGVISGFFGGGGGGGGFYGSGETTNGFGSGGSSYQNGGAGGGGIFLQGGNGGFGGGGGGYTAGGGGGGYSGGIGGASYTGGGGGGSIIDSTANIVLAEVSGVASPDGSRNGEVIITVVPEPSTPALAWIGGSCLLVFSHYKNRKIARHKRRSA